MRKRVIAVLIITVIIFAATFCVGYFRLDFASGEEVVAETVHVDAALLENGDLRIEETSTFQYEDRGSTWWNFYRTFAWEEIDDIYDISVYDHDYDTEYGFTNAYLPSSYTSITPTEICYLIDGYPDRVWMRQRGWTEEKIQSTLQKGNWDEESPYWEVGFNFPGIREGTRTFTLCYTLSGVKQIEKYSDVDVLYYQFVQADTYPIKSFSMELHFPNKGTAEDLDAWLHCTAAGTLDIQNDTSIVVEASYIPADVFLEVRLLMSAGSLQSAGQQHDTPVRQTIVQEERAWQISWFDTQRYQWFAAAVSVALGAGLVALAFGLKSLQRALDKKSVPQTKDAEYQRQLPYPVSPAVAGWLLKYAARAEEKQEKKENDLLIASTLNLVEKGWLTMEEKSDDDGRRMLWFAPGEGHAPMAEEEELLMGLYRAVGRRKGGRFSMQQYRNYVRDNYITAQKTMKQYFSVVEKEFRAQDWGLRFGFFTSFCAWFCVAFLACALMLLLAFSFFGRSMLIIGLLLGSGILVFGALGRTRLTRTGREAYEKWMGFARYLKEFTLAEERGPKEVPLWGKYMICGTALGVGKEVAAQMADLAPKNLKDMAGEAGRTQSGAGDNLTAKDDLGEPTQADLYSAMYWNDVGGGIPNPAASAAAFAAIGNNITNVFSDMRNVGETLSIANAESARLKEIYRQENSSSGGGGFFDSGGSSGGGGGSFGGGGGGGGGSSGFR